MKYLLLLAASLFLAGCFASAAEIENADDATCQRAIAQRVNPTPDAYSLCRQNLMNMRTASAIRSQ